MAGKLPTKQAIHKTGEYGLVPKFLGYRAREDNTTLPIGTLVSPSQNVVIKTSGRVSLVKGYALDGTGSTVIDSGILSNFDFTNFKGDVRNLRAGFLTSAANDGKLQYRYLDATSTVNWVTLKSSLTNVRLSYTEYWDNTALVKNVLWVDGTNNIFAWNGAVTTFASGTTNKAISFVGNSASLTAYSDATGTSSFIKGNNGGIGTALLAYVSLTAQPTDGQTLVITINSTAITLHFVSLIGATAGNVLIGANLSATMTNLLGILQAPGTTNANQVALSGANQTLVGYITFASNNNTVTKQGTNTWAQEGFSTTGSIVINGVSYTYAGGGYSTTLFGISADVSGSTLAAIVHQDVVATTLASMTNILSTFGPTVIGCGRRNQVYVGASNSSNLYISKVNSYTDYSFTTPTRVVGEGALIPLDAPPVGFLPLESRTDTNAYDMYISEGLSNWSFIRATLSADLTKETLENIRMKVAPLQGAKSGRLMGKMKNHIIYVGNDNVANFIGYTSYQYVPETVDFSYTIIDDMSSYDLTDASIFYHKNYIYITIPKSGITRVYNMTNQTKETTSSIRGVEDVDQDQPWYWEAPITFPISGLYVTPDKGLCGHNFTTSESYQLFTGGNLNGQNIVANMTLAYDDKGDRTQSKGSNECWVEGRIAQNTKPTLTITGDIDTFATSQSVVIDGSNNNYVAFGSGAHSLGTTPLGSESLGGANLSSSLSAYFHVALTYPQVPSYLEKLSIDSDGVDLDWEIITIGSNATPTSEGNNSITV